MGVLIGDLVLPADVKDDGDRAPVQVMIRNNRIVENDIFTRFHVKFPELFAIL